MAMINWSQGKKWAVIVAALLIIWAEMAGHATASVVVRNSSNKAVTVSSNSSDPAVGQVLQPGGTLALSPGAYYLSNVKIAQADLILDTRMYAIRNALTTVGLVQVYLVAVGSGTVSVVADRAPITGEF